MILSKNIYTPTKDAKSRKHIEKINHLRNSFIAKRAEVSIQMTKAYLDYYALTKDKYKWRFEALYNQIGAESLNEEGRPTSVSTQWECTFKSAEQMFSTKYRSYYLCKEKINELYNNISSRRYDVNVESIPYHSYKHVFNHLLRNQFVSADFRRQFDIALKNASIKGTGFLRPVIYDTEVNYTYPVVGKARQLKEGKQQTMSYKTGLRIESIDPETVFVDPYSQDPEIGFIITPYSAIELAARFPSLKSYIREYDETVTTNKQYEANYINPESVYNFHGGELLKKMYDANDLMQYANYFEDIGADGMMMEGKECCDRNGDRFYSKTLWSRNMAESFFDKCQTNSEQKNYYLTEYYNVIEDLYMAYVGDVLLYKGPIIEPFKQFPVCPIHFSTEKQDSFYGAPMTEDFVEQQDKFNEYDHDQRLSGLITNKQLLGVQDDLLNEEYHPNRQIEITKNSPVNYVHFMGMGDVEKQGQPLFPIQLNNGADVNLQSKKNESMALADRYMPSIKGMESQANQEMRQDFIYDRDLLSNKLLQVLADVLSQFAYKVFSSVILELQYFKGSGVMIPLPFRSGQYSSLVICNNPDELKKEQQKMTKQLELIYEGDLQKKMDEIAQTRPEIVQSIVEPLSKMAEAEVLNKYKPNGFQDEKDQALSLQALQQMPEAQAMISQFVEQNAPMVIQQKLREIASPMVQRPVDTNIYLDVLQLQDAIALPKQLKFIFHKSKQEKQRDINNVISFIKPLEQYAPFYLNVKEFINEAIIASDLNPDAMLVPNPETPEQIMKFSQTRVNYFGGLDKHLAVWVKHLNENAGREVFTVDQLLTDMQKQMAMEGEFKKDEINARTQTKAGSQMLLKQQDVALKDMLAQNDSDRIMQRNSAMTPADGSGGQQGFNTGEDGFMDMSNYPALS